MAIIESKRVRAQKHDSLLSVLPPWKLQCFTSHTFFPYKCMLFSCSCASKLTDRRKWRDARYICIWYQGQWINFNELCAFGCAMSVFVLVYLMLKAFLCSLAYFVYFLFFLSVFSRCTWNIQTPIQCQRKIVCFLRMCVCVCFCFETLRWHFDGTQKSKCITIEGQMHVQNILHIVC